MRRLLAVALIAALAGCGGGDEDKDVAEGRPTTTTTAAPTTTATTAAPPPTAPLTGAPEADEARRTRPAVVVKIENSRFSRGLQEGLDEADVVYVEKVEEGVTRLAAVYQSTDADPVMPVRSARSSDVTITGNLNRPLFAFSGANGGVLGQIAGANLVDLGRDAHGDLYRGSGLYGVSTSTGAMYGAAPSPPPGPPPPLFAYRPAGAPFPGEETGGVRLSYQGRINTQVDWAPDLAGWARSQDGTAHTEGSGGRVTAANVVVQLIEYRDSGFVDTTGAVSPEAVLVGEGEALVLSGDRLVRGRWSRADAGAVTVFSDESGAPIALAPGRTWVELVPVGGAEVR